jgi:hypothetical protein
VPLLSERAEFFLVCLRKLFGRRYKSGQYFSCMKERSKQIARAKKGKITQDYDSVLYEIAGLIEVGRGELRFVQSTRL